MFDTSPETRPTGLWTDADILSYLKANRGKLAPHTLLDLDAPTLHFHYFSDSNMNQVVQVSDGVHSVIVKHAPPFLRIVGPSWPISTDRNAIEAQYLVEASTILPGSVPQVYLHEGETIVMEAIDAHESARFALIAGKQPPHLGQAIGRFVAQMSYRSSAFSLSEIELAAAAQRYINPDPCKITDDLFFTDPYIFWAASNQFSSPLCLKLDAISQDAALKAEVAMLRHKFDHHKEALIHGDLHTGSILVDETGSTKILDGEFACYGPIGFDLGTFIANLIINHMAHVGLSDNPSTRSTHQVYLLEQIHQCWNSFTQEFKALAGVASAPADSVALETVEAFLENVWRDTVGYAGTECIRRVVGLAHTKDVNDIPNHPQKVEVEKALLGLGQALIKARTTIPDCASLCEAIETAEPAVRTSHSAHCFLSADELQSSITLAYALPSKQNAAEQPFAANQIAVEIFRKTFYPELILSPAEMETLSWCMTSPVTTPSGEVGVDVHFEVKRALNRLSNMEFLRTGDYAAFVRTQDEPKMRPDQFEFFSAKIQALNEAEYAALRAVTIIGSLPFAPKAKELAGKILGTLPVDSVEFLDLTLSRCPEIYPAFNALAPEVQSLLRESFAFGHLRHMLYIEGNQGMYKALQDACERITDSEARKKYFDFWYLQWFVNITGFKVTLGGDPHGSKYLNQGNAEALMHLNVLIERGITDPSTIPQILPDYLAFRSAKLGLEAEEGQRNLMMQIAAFSRIYSPSATVTELAAALSSVPPEMLARPDTLKTRTPTYVPALFDNTLALLPGEPQLALRIALSIYLTAFREYSGRIADGDSFTMPPLSLRLAADKTGLQAIIDDLHRFPERQSEMPCCTLTLNERFEVIVQPRPAPSPRTFAEMGRAADLEESAESTA